MPAPITFGARPPYLPAMTADRQQAVAEFRRMIKWILIIAVLMVAGALTYLHLASSLTLNMVIATILGVFFSVLLGCGLFAASFFSDKSGHDQSISDSTRRERDKG
jgi:lipopolysaccharide export LptBFGC system permease protein LptF